MSTEDRARAYGTDLADWLTEHTADFHTAYLTSLAENPSPAAGSLWVMRTVDLPPDRYAQAKIDHPDIKDPRATGLTRIELFPGMEKVARDGLPQCLEDLCGHLAIKRLESPDGQLPPDLASKPTAPSIGTVLSLMETEIATGDRYLSLYLMTGAGDGFIRRRAVTGARAGQVVDAGHVRLPLQRPPALQAGVSTGDIHPYFVTLIKLHIILTLDHRRLGGLAEVMAGRHIDRMIDDFVENILAGRPVGGRAEDRLHPQDPARRN